MVEWPRGEAAACKAAYTGSNPVSTSLTTECSNEGPRGRLAQGLARFLDTEEVTGSIPVSPTDSLWTAIEEDGSYSMSGTGAIAQRLEHLDPMVYDSAAHVLLLPV